MVALSASGRGSKLGSPIDFCGLANVGGTADLVAPLPFLSEMLSEDLKPLPFQTGLFEHFDVLAAHPLVPLHSNYYNPP
jgi:hypothetical protein